MYHTAGVVLSRRLQGEQDLTVGILTDDPELGLIRAHVTSGASAASRMRVALEPLTHGSYVFVRGRRRWKLVGAQALHWFAPQIWARGNARQVGVLLSFLSETVPSEGFLPPEVFAHTLLFLNRAAQQKLASRDVFTHSIAPLLHILGYLPSATGWREDQVAQALWACGATSALYYWHATPTTTAAGSTR